VLYARRGGPSGAVADSFGFSLLGGGGEKPARVFAVLSRAEADTAAPANVRAGAAALRTELLAEIARMTASSPRNARAHSTAATLAITERRWDDARRELEGALAADPATPMAHFRLAGLALTQGRAQDAVREYELERATGGDRPGIEFGRGMALRTAGDEGGARRAFEREIRRWPGAITARAAEEALSRPRERGSGAGRHPGR
jgi:predicted Zn-dependent protease